MSINRIQFQTGMSMPEFLKQFGTEAQCEAALEQSRWPKGFVCPGCGETGCSVFIVGAHKMFQCRACHHQTLAHRWNALPEHQTAADHLVFGNLPRQPSQNGLVGTGVKAVSGRQVPDGMADPA